MESPERPPSIEAIADTRKPYPRLTAAQKDRICYQVRLYLAAMTWIQSGYQAQTFVYQAEQPNLFAPSAEPI